MRSTLHDILDWFNVVTSEPFHFESRRTCYHAMLYRPMSSF